MIVYFNGQFMEKDEVRISPDDRGFVFGDGIYEVVRTYNGRLFRMEDHLRRMEYSLEALYMDGPTPETVRDIADQLMRDNGLTDAVFYLQITRGAAPRRHAFHDPAPPPTVYASVKPPTEQPKKHEDGVATLLVPDLRWARCDIKSVSLLPNVLASSRAHEAGVEEAIFVRDCVVTEGSHTNVAAVFGGELRTYPLSNYILPGVTRTVILELCQALGVPYREDPIFEHELRNADELMLLGTSTEVMPVVRVNDWKVGKGRPGPVTRRLRKAFREYAHSSLETAAA